MKRNTPMLQNLSLAGLAPLGFARDTHRQWTPPLSYKAGMMRDTMRKQWKTFVWKAPRVQLELNTDTVTAGIVGASTLVFATVAMLAFMAVADLAHAEPVVHDEDLYSLSKPVEPSAGNDPIITPVMVQPHVVQVRDDDRTHTTVNESPAVITQSQGGPKPDIRVMLPSGEVIRVANPVNGNWWDDPRVNTYRTYYFDPEQDYYVIYTDANRPWKTWEGRWDEDGKPCGPGLKSC